MPIEMGRAVGLAISGCRHRVYGRHIVVRAMHCEVTTPQAASGPSIHACEESMEIFGFICCRRSCTSSHPVKSNL